MIVVLVILIIIALLIFAYAYRNLHLDEGRMKKVWKAGFVEKQVDLPKGTKLNYGEGGSENSPCLLLIHGQGQAWQDYDEVLPKLAEKYHVFAVDCHGHGKSSHDKSRYTCKAMTEDFVWFAKNIIGTPCVVSGHSSGGILAANMAATCPDQITALLIEDSPFFCVEPDEMKKRNAVVWIDSFQLMHNFSNQSETNCFNEYWLKNSLVMSLFGNLRYKVAASAKRFADRHPGEPLRIWYVPQSILRGMYYGNMFDLKFAETFYDGSWFDGVSQEEILHKIKCQCTYIKAKTGYLKDGKMNLNPGTEDMTGAVLCCANNDEDAQHVLRLVDGCKIVKTESNDHLIHLKYPEVFVSEAQAFIQE